MRGVIQPALSDLNGMEETTETPVHITTAPQTAAFRNYHNIHSKHHKVYCI